MDPFLKKITNIKFTMQENLLIYSPDTKKDIQLLQGDILVFTGKKFTVENRDKNINLENIDFREVSYKEFKGLLSETLESFTEPESIFDESKLTKSEKKYLERARKLIEKR